MATALPSRVFDNGPKKTGRLAELQPAVSAMIANTRYYEINSTATGARHAVWVTTPPGY